MNLREKLDNLGEEEVFKREVLEYVYMNFLKSLTDTPATDSEFVIKKELPKLLEAHNEWKLALRDYNLVLGMYREEALCTQE